MNGWKVSFFILLFILLLGSVGITSFYFGRNSFPFFPMMEATPTPLPNLTEEPTPTVDETFFLKEAIFTFTEIDPAKAEIVIGENTGEFAKGTIKEQEAVGGAYWLG